MCVASLLCGLRADLWPFYGFLCKRFSLYIKVARGPHWRDVTHILSGCFLLKAFHFRRLQRRWVFFPYKSLYFECYATMPMFADAHISTLGYLCSHSMTSMRPNRVLPHGEGGERGAQAFIGLVETLQCWSYYMKINFARHQHDTDRTQNRAGLQRSTAVSPLLRTLRYSGRGRGGRQPEVKCSILGTN